ncbi:cation-translocating P-type ATPase [Mycoplasmopsis arginini]|uniref:cation-translocating P-type ATPase n=1 Tax=Mycoplasmopsis arginini TaxID=2094 RepID=UPI0002D1B514|nr:cation-transporting P-type ATPase [Mycoplasmopsis arginini]ENY69553.1 Cation-transporting P-type ATPase [Mycoplasmopsis arginini 7264]BAQ54374.1 caion-transporting P-type ATPase [Mycoplasmopsis arginini]
MKKQKIEEYPKIEDNMLEINLKQGLTNEEAINRQKKYGLNELKKTKKINPFLVYLSQFKDVLVIILLCASLLSYIFAIISGSKHNWNFNSELVVEFVEPSIILFVVLTNSLIGAIQEIKSAKAVDALSKLNPLQAKVVRNGVLVSIDSKDVTIGDVVMLEAGDVVPADGYLLFSSNLSAIESSLTGESEPSIKDYLSERDFSLPLADRKFMVYSSSIIATGTAYYVVSAIGSQTELGKISALVSQQKEAMSPLQIKINKLGKIFGYVGIALFLGSMLMQILFAIPNTSHYKELYFWSTVIVNGVSLAVAAIPEGLIAFTSIILAIGVQRMAKKKAVVKDLMAVESLGSCAVICSDKTGTLTQNKMTIVDLYNLENDKLTNSQMSNNYLKLIEFGSLCSEANLSFEDNEYKPVGDPTEVSFLYELEKYSQYKTKTELVSQYERIHVWPFDSDRKLMTSINKINDKFMVIVKGAPDVLINKTTLEKNNKEKVLKVNNEWANQAYRVLAIASKEISKKELDELFLKNNDYQLNYLENNLSFDGLVAMIDPPREEAKAAISICRQAGIKPVMITGDNINTAIAIAKSLNIYNDGDLAISGLELEKISDDELTNNIDKYSVYARVKPEDKLRIVNAWQKRNQVVAMTGDGVNDAPALKASDIGCAMGITGTEASKQAANMILADDNFTTIVSAVKNGRSIYQKIKNVIQNLLITSIAEVILVFLGLLIFKFVFKDWSELKGKEIYILSATQLLWINLFTHGFPAIALGLQNSKEDYMNKRPISKYESIFANGMGWNTLWQGIIIGILSMVGYYLGALWAKNNGDSGENIIRAASTIAFLVLGITATFNSINLMSKKPVIMSNPFYYWKVYASVIFSLFFLLLVAFINKISVVFKGYEQLKNSPTLIAYGLGLPLILIPIYFIHKIILLLIEKKNQKQNTIKNFEMILTPRERKQAKK